MPNEMFNLRVWDHIFEFDPRPTNLIGKVPTKNDLILDSENRRRNVYSVVVLVQLVLKPSFHTLLSQYPQTTTHYSLPHTRLSVYLSFVAQTTKYLTNNNIPLHPSTIGRKPTLIADSHCGVVLSVLSLHSCALTTAQYQCDSVHYIVLS